MAQNYTRQSSFSDGDTISASIFNDEYNQIVNAFSYSSSSASSTGHRHDGSSGQGGNIFKIGDLDFLNKIEVDDTNNRWGFYVEVSSAAVEQIRIQDGAIVPVTNNDIDLGTSSLEFKDLFLDGTAHIDTLDVDVNATVAGTLGVTGATTLSSTLAVTGAVTANAGVVVDNITIDGTEIDLSSGDLTVDVAGDIILDADGGDVLLKDAGVQYAALTNNSGNLIIKSGSTTMLTASGANATFAGNVDVDGNLTVTGTTTFNGGTLTLGDAASDNVVFGADVNSNIIPNTDNAYDLGSSSQEWKDLYVDGIAYLDGINFNGTAISATAAEINILDGVTATATELNLLDGVTATTAELNYVDGVTSAIQTQLDAKAPTASPTFTGTVTVPGLTTTADVSFGDNDKAIFGAGSDLQIYHDGSHSYIEDAAGTGNLKLRTNTLRIENAAGTELSALFVQDGAATLYNDNTARLATTSTGIDVTGDVVSDGLTVDGDGSFTGNFEISGLSPKIFLNETDTTDVNSRIRSAGGKLEIQTVDNSDANPVTRFQINHSTGDVSIPSGDLDVTGTVTADGLTVDGSATIQASSSPALIVKDTTNNAEARLQAFNSTATVGTQSNHSFSIETNDTNRALFASNGDISFYEDTGTTAKFFWDASAESLGIGTINPTGDLEIATSATDTGVDLVLDGNKTSNGGVGSIIFNNNGDSVGMIRSNRASANDAADMLFYTQATGGANSERMRIDSSGNVGIGTSSPVTLKSSTTLQVDGNAKLGDDNGRGLLSLGDIASTGANAGIWRGAAGAYAGTGNFLNLGGYDGITFTTGNADISSQTERMRIDSSGNLLVGKTSASSATVGFQAGQDGFIAATRASAQPLVLNRTTNDGIIADFRKDGSTVGSIGTATADTYPYFASSTFGFRLRNSTKTITPSTSTGANNDAAVDLGYSSSRFKDLHLSGNVNAAQVNLADAGGTLRNVLDLDGSDNLKVGTGSSAGTRAITFFTENTEQMRLDASGNLLVGKTSASGSTVGGEIRATGAVLAVRDGDFAGYFNRKTSDGEIVRFVRDTTTVGSISAVDSDLLIMSSQSGHKGLRFGNGYIAPTNNSGAVEDNTTDLGLNSYRFQDIYAANGTIQTSDRNEKQDIEALSDAEQRVAVACKGLLRKFRWKSAVEEKGDEARIHFGIIAQDLKSAFEAEGLDAGRYGMFINTTWTDEETGEERSRMGVRYSELLAFIIAAI